MTEVHRRTTEAAATLAEVLHLETLAEARHPEAQTTAEEDLPEDIEDRHQ